jgi:hypothetical protein
MPAPGVKALRGHSRVSKQGPANAIERSGAEAVLLGGDIAEAGSLEGFLRLLAGRLHTPLYFVLGNHDFFGGNVAGIRGRLAALTREGLGASWLGEAGVVPLIPCSAATPIRRANAGRCPS